jgi:hypothetical protein
MTKLLYVLAAALVAGCTATIPLRPLDARHPASPDAREAAPQRLRGLAPEDPAAVPNAAPAAPGGHHAH